MKKKILITGPINDFGGREIMTNLLFHTFKDSYKTKILSTTLMSKKSVAIKKVNSNSWDSVSYYLFRNYLVLRFTALLAKAVNKRNESAYFFIDNKLSKLFFNFNKLFNKAIEKFISETDFIIYSDEINGEILKKIIVLTERNKKPILIIITGEIKTLPSFFYNLNHNINVLVHSKQNENKLINIPNLNISHIEQTTALEDDLLNLEIQENTTLVYGFLGRFSEEKGIKEVINAFSNTNKKLVLAGNGPFLNDVLLACKANEDIIYIGELSHDKTCGFYEMIDVFIIASFEEGGPIVGIEAMAAGKLIISTRVGAMPERLSETRNQFWVDHKEKDSFKKTLYLLENINKRERLAIRQEVRKKYINQNALFVMKDSYLELIKKIINS